MQGKKSDFERFIVLKSGKPVLKNVKLSVEEVLDLFAEGKTTEEILNMHPGLTEKQIRAVFGYSSSFFKGHPIFPVLSPEQFSKEQKEKSLEEEKETAGENPFVPKTPLAKKMWKIRQKIVASGEKLLSLEKVWEEVRDRRGERE
jgi:uncharacterized protein (DUF433 family)